MRNLENQVACSGSDGGCGRLLCEVVHKDHGFNTYQSMCRWSVALRVVQQVTTDGG